MDSDLDSRRGARGLVAGGALGVLVGGAIGWFLHGREQEARAAPEFRLVARDVVDPSRETATRTPSADPDAKPATADASRSAEFSAADRNAFDAELARRGRDGIVSGWAQVRRDAIPVALLDGALKHFESDVGSEPERLGRKLAEELTKQEEAARQGREFLELEKMKQGQEVDRKLVDDPDRFNALFERRSGEIPLDGTQSTEDLAKKVADGTTITFAAGVFAFDLAAMLPTMDPRVDAPRDITIAGAGMDRTLLVASSEPRLVSRVRDWTFRDCTLYTDGELISSHGDASLTLDRIRVLGFDTGAGGSNALFLMGNVLRCRDSIFEGGYGRSPRYGRLLDVRSDAMLARFEGCRFAELAIDFTRPSWRIAFESCRFEQLRVFGRERPGFPPGIVTTDCSFTYADASGSEEPPKKNLKTLFPGYDEAKFR